MAENVGQFKDVTMCRTNADADAIRRWFISDIEIRKPYPVGTLLIYRLDCVVKKDKDVTEQS
jgi:hypothetical protein